MTYNVDQQGFFGRFGGSYIPEMLHANVAELQQRYLEIINSNDYQQRFQKLLKDYVGRPTALYYADRLSQHFGMKIYLKREDLNHTGAHKINNAIGQALVAQSLGKTRIIAETGAGQHGVATATACALLNLKCVVYMGAVDIERQAPNVSRMHFLGAEVRPVHSGSKTLKDAANEAMRDWIANPQDTHYIIGSAVGPHPFPDMVARFQSVISAELKDQLRTQIGREHPDFIVACIGGGSNAIGAFYHYLDNAAVRLIGVEAAGEGLTSGHSAATLALGSEGILHGSRTFVMQSADGQVQEAHSISAGLDYPGIGPQHAYLREKARVAYVSITDEEALQAALLLARHEGIIAALESTHAIAYLAELCRSSAIGPDSVVVVNLSGRGDKDMAAYEKYLARVKDA